jgi:mediator of RNA polymerase II transcription subunit 31
MAPESPPKPAVPQITNPRFTLELEFVLSLANPHYLSHLATTYPHLLGMSSLPSQSANDRGSSSEAQAFAAYLAYLYDYWKRPEYVQFLTHPGATLRALRLLQEESFRHAVIRPQVVEDLLRTGLEQTLPVGTGDKEKEAESETQMTGDMQVDGERRNGVTT